MRRNGWLQIRGTVVLCALSGLLAGCASNSGTTPSTSAQATGQIPNRYKSDDGRTVEIGRSSPVNGGLSFKNPHMDKCWIADGFNFTGYDTLYIAPTLSTAKLHNAEENQPHEAAKQNLQLELERLVRQRQLVPNVVLQESQIKPGAHVLKMENNIVEYAKGGGAARYWAGMYGAGQPILRVQGKMTDTNKTVFEYEARRSGTSAGSRMVGGYMKDTDIQREDVASMSLDLVDFMSAITGKFQAK